MYASKITIIFFLGNTNHSILFLYNLVIVYANRTSNAVIFKRLSKGLQIYTSLLIDFCNDYRPHLCWQVSCILFAKIISSSDFNLSSKKNLSFLEVKKKNDQPPCVQLLLHTIGQHISLKKFDLHSLLELICPSMISKIFSSIYIFVSSILHVGWLPYHLWRNIFSGRTAWNTKEMWGERQRN